MLIVTKRKSLDFFLIDCPNDLMDAASLVAVFPFQKQFPRHRNQSKDACSKQN